MKDLNPPPVITGEQLIVDVENYGSKGDGVAKIGNYVLIIPWARPKRKYNVNVTKVFRTYAFAEILNEITE